MEERVRIQEEMPFFQVVCTYVRMRNHTVMLVKIKGGKKRKNPSWPVKYKDATGQWRNL